MNMLYKNYLTEYKIYKNKNFINKIKKPERNIPNSRLKIEGITN